MNCHWTPGKLNLRAYSVVIHLISKTVTWSHYQTYRESTSCPGHPAVLLWFCLQLLLPEGCDGADSSGAPSVTPQLILRAWGDMPASLTRGTMPKESCPLCSGQSNVPALVFHTAGRHCHRTTEYVELEGTHTDHQSPAPGLP